jgi:MYXO-CTERM domain-containing protein
MRLQRAFAALVLVLLAGVARADVVWYEVVNGDLSNDPSAPTPITLALGTNTVIAAVNADSDPQDWMAITIPAGYQLSAMVLGDYDSLDHVAFTGFQAGPTFVGDPVYPPSYMGYTHFGTDVIGEDLLALMSDPANDPGAQGFTPPLASGVYTFFVQQLGQDSLYQFDFEVTAVPGPGGLALAGVVGLGVGRRRRG